VRRIERKKLKQDEFVSIVDRLLDWLTANWRPVLAAFAAVCLVVLLWWGLGVWRQRRELKAATLLASTLEQLDKATTDEARAEAEKKLDAIVSELGGTRQADLARVILARELIERGELERARELLVAVARRHADIAQVRVATLDLVHLQLATGQAAEAIRQLRAMAAGEDPRLPRDAALYELARAYLEEGKVDDARTTFQKLVDGFPESPYLQDARRRLEELG